ncbi:polysaccharide deacetylase family protein [Parablastomonas sp. CN1-191]|uniref:polysaccharide deacetylase family protein n=1 Tax=Parablastomonas sp. CN1-191 TaxID=3400908 RepID=UPI003BF88164
MAQPIFYDPTGKRSRVAKRTLAGALVLLLLAAVLFAATLVFVPRSTSMALPLPAPHASALRGTPPARGLRAWLPHLSNAPADKPLSVGFYLPDDETSIASLRRHAASLDWVVPMRFSVDASGAITTAPDAAFDRLIAAMPHPPQVMPMVQNYANEKFDGAAAARLLADPAARARLAATLGTAAAAPNVGGVVLDIEDLPTDAMPHYLTFLDQLRRAMPRGDQIAITVPAGDPSWPIRAIARRTDRVLFMAYDQHWQGGEAGPIASQDWFVREVARARAEAGPKLVVTLGSYGYDWHGAQDKVGGVDALTVEEAWLAAHDSNAAPRFDPVSGNAGFAYDDAGEHHSVWFVDAASSWNQLAALKRLGIGAVALWRLGSEDPGFWSDLGAFRSGGRPDLATPESPLNNDVEGTGEIIRITDTAQPGHRDVAYDAAGLIRGETYTALPTPFVVQRSGGSDPKAIALTFDDGPDPVWTPRILDVLKREGVPGTFFVIGENALENPSLLRRMVAEGHVIGNHTYTHPNLAGASQTDTDFELSTNERLVEAYTGRRMRLFRAPYFGDAEPTTADELIPALRAQQAGYTIVGLHVDTEDWQRPPAAAIVRTALTEIHAANAERTGNIVLLHDGGGNRAETVAALPQIIAALRGEGYRFVSVPQLVGASAAQAMPQVTGSDLTAVRFDIAGFLAVAALIATVGFLFYLAIVLGITRAVLMTALAWIQSRRRRAEPPLFEPTVTVIIPAFNEERVIVSSIARVLASEYPALQVIVADDGSRDRTSDLVREAFGSDPRVLLLTLTNGGKAAALNRAVRDARGEVIIALDADTQFEALTIRRLARWFGDPRLGAVAGDARVGNRVNLVTRWQAVEYITAQNLERRALAGFDAMTVVPGAVGAWRRAALDAVGGYPEDTLAEDQDLTIAIQRFGWRVTYDPRATAWTEAPESFAALAKQRYRWAFGTLQCLWKHRSALRRGRPTGLALIGMPQAWLFQILFAAISPVIDLALLLSLVGTALRIEQHGWAQTRGDVGTMGLYWLAFTAIDVLCGWIAYRLDDRRPRYPAHLLVAQRLVYRQIMYWVVLRAIASAIGGWVVGWGKLERSGRVETAA